MTDKRLWPAALATAAILASATAWAGVPADDAPAAGPSAAAATPESTPAKTPTPTRAVGDTRDNRGPSRFGGTNATNPSNLLGQSLAAVLVILVLGAAGVFVVKRLLPRLGVAQGRQIQVLETVYLGPRKNLYMVQVGQRTLLVSGTRERLSLLTDLTGSVPLPTAGDGRRVKARFTLPATDEEDA